MKLYVAFLRAVNVGGTGRLPMADLRDMCGEIGFRNVATYIASGNILFESDASKKAVQEALQKRLAEYAGKPVGVMIRTATELRRILADNPFPDSNPSRTLVTLLDERPPRDALANAVGQADEEARVGESEIYVHYPGGMGRSKLRIPAAKDGTARNMNTVAKMIALAASRSPSAN